MSFSTWQNNSLCQRPVSYTHLDVYKRQVAAFDYAQATISQHMKKLVESGLIEVKKKDKFSFYYANLGILMQYIDITKKYSII